DGRLWASGLHDHRRAPVAHEAGCGALDGARRGGRGPRGAASCGALGWTAERGERLGRADRAPLMKFTAVDGSREHGSIYRSERYDLAHKVAGFGIVLVEVWDRCSGGRPRKLTQFTGHNALNDAMAWCQSH